MFVDSNIANMDAYGCCKSVNVIQKLGHIPPANLNPLQSRSLVAQSKGKEQSWLALRMSMVISETLNVTKRCHS